MAENFNNFFSRIAKDHSHKCQLQRFSVRLYTQLVLLKAIENYENIRIQQHTKKNITSLSSDYLQSPYLIFFLQMVFSQTYLKS